MLDRDVNGHALVARRGVSTARDHIAPITFQQLVSTRGRFSAKFYQSGSWTRSSRKGPSAMEIMDLQVMTRAM